MVYNNITEEKGDLHMKIGEKVAEYREQHGLSQREFARRCDLSHVIIGFLEKGERTDGSPYLPRFDTIRKVARGMGTSAEALISECEDFNLDISVGMEETPIYADILQSHSTDEIMLLQAYRMIPIEHRIEAMQAVFKIKDMYDN
jgi:transcriptional regulator with XRE-family HTH domain